MSIAYFLLSPRQKAILLALVKEVTIADGHVSSYEGKYLLFLNELLSNDITLNEDPYNLVTSEFTSAEHKFALITTLFIVPFLDNQVHPQEVKFIKDLVAQLNLPEEKIKQMLLWAQRQALQITEALDFKL
ncbi:hypothetical protein CJP74_05270 [Psittacicella melopsittaci]|uniref:Tellurite resistance protein TerB n=1 Tax=Psittacicella melopsittaci TaxID=2028576 RepID=A0A3A1Y7R8_9GAMM|nr:hypothetical protein [Psittacicella melopsittaci]RIY32177.1 hypothetical protein CJP74_05270 [Psittacicella melopsittaci]